MVQENGWRIVERKIGRKGREDTRVIYQGKKRRKDVLYTTDKG
jgi:hypothetical protein